MSKANRKSNRTKRVSHSCRNHGSCQWCTQGRTHQFQKEEFYTKKQIEEALNLDKLVDSENEHIVSEKHHETINKIVLEDMANKKIDNLLDQWHESDATCNLWEFLGWTKEEYKDWFEKGKIPQSIFTLILREFALK